MSIRGGGPESWGQGRVERAGVGKGWGDLQLKGTALQLLQDPTIHDKLEHLLVG